MGATKREALELLDKLGLARPDDDESGTEVTISTPIGSESVSLD